MFESSSQVEKEKILVVRYKVFIIAVIVMVLVTSCIKEEPKLQTDVFTAVPTTEIFMTPSTTPIPTEVSITPSTTPKPTDNPNEISPTTAHGTVTDIDGNVYPTIQLGDQWWMAANLNVTNNPDGNPITAYCYENVEANCAVYGRLYNWKVAMNRSTKEGAQGICPTGWHIPSDSEWQELIDYLGGEDVAGGKIKEVGDLHWANPNTGATNESQFNALPAGFFDFTGEFGGLGEICFIRTSSAQDYSEVYARELSYRSTSLERGGIHPNDAIPIRCVQD